MQPFLLHLRFIFRQLMMLQGAEALIRHSHRQTSSASLNSHCHSMFTLDTSVTARLSLMEDIDVIFSQFPPTISSKAENNRRKLEQNSRSGLARISRDISSQIESLPSQQNTFCLLFLISKFPASRFPIRLSQLSFSLLKLNNFPSTRCHLHRR